LNHLLNFKESPITGKYINVNENGFRLIQNQASWPPNNSNINIFIFGGSTTFGYGVSDEQTVPSYLQNYLRQHIIHKKVCVYNFGRGHYYSSQELVLFEKLLWLGIIPEVVIFIDGLNDF